MAAAETLSASLEDYLETIFHLVEERRVARVKDIAARMSVQMPSVTGALRSLADKDLVRHDPYSYTTLTPRGEAIAREIVRRHEVLTGFLSDFLGLERETAERNACHMEHAIEPVVLERLVEFVEFAERCPRAGATWVRGMAHACREGDEARSCEQCIQRCLDDVRAGVWPLVAGKGQTDFLSSSSSSSNRTPATTRIEDDDEDDDEHDSPGSGRPATIGGHALRAEQAKRDTDDEQRE